MCGRETHRLISGVGPGVAAVDEADDREQHHRADERDEHRAQPEVADPLVAGEAEEPAADQAADDADDDRAEAAEVASRRR